MAYFAEVPAVLFNVQRGGPSTGMPTRTQQSDILSSAYASHGDTKHIMLIPSNPKECFDFAIEAFDLAERYQTPVIVLLDLDLGMNDWSSKEFEWDDLREYDRGKVLSKNDLDEIEEFGRYLDVDGEVLFRLRNKMGHKFPIICTLDKHANISTKMFENADILVVFRTCPHLDTYDRGVEAAKLMKQMLNNELKPTGTFIAPPMMINMTKQNTFEEPVSKIIEDMESLSNDPSIVSASFALGFQFADVPELGASFIVYTNDNCLLYTSPSPRDS